MIEVQHLTKRYGRVTAVDDVSFRVERGEILGFLGPNGAGKTTTMRILTGYMPATEGKAVVAGFDVFDQPIEAKRRTGYLPETPPLYPDMTVGEYLDVRRQDQGRAVGRARAARIQAIMERTRIADMANAPAASCRRATGSASGWRRRSSTTPTCSSSTSRPPASIPKQIIETRQLIKELAGDHTIILSTHILPEVAQTCQRVVIINKGKVVAVDTPDNLTARLRGSETMYVQVDAQRRRRRGARSRGSRRDARRRSRIAATASSATRSRASSGHDIRRDLARAVVTSGWGLLELRPMRMSLEEIFLSLTTDEAAQWRRTPTPSRGEEKPSMSNILAIAQKELKSYFASPIALHRDRLLRAPLRLLLRPHPAATSCGRACRWARWAAAAASMNINEG